jgi:hypothetical protein
VKMFVSFLFFWKQRKKRVVFLFCFDMVTTRQYSTEIESTLYFERVWSGVWE